jgi:DNA-binding Lrp family transcriptional regulator
VTAKNAAAPRGDELTAQILRELRRAPNQERPLDALAQELGIVPEALQLAVERLHRRRFVIAPFIEPGRAGGAKLTAVGLSWLIAREGGTPRDTPVAFQPAKRRVRTEDEAARLPRADVYGVKS